jgi:hypothetical protein
VFNLECLYRVIWSVRNDCIFNNGVVIIEEVVDQMKMLSWKWFIGRVAKGLFLLYERKGSPLDCMLRWLPAIFSSYFRASVSAALICCFFLMYCRLVCSLVVGTICIYVLFFSHKTCHMFW